MHLVLKADTGTAGAEGVSWVIKAIAPPSSLGKGVITGALESTVSNLRVASEEN